MSLNTHVQQNAIVALVYKILAAKATPKVLPRNLVRGDTAAADTSEAGGHVECSETSVWEKQIDKLVYALYNLTEEEIKIVEEQK